MLRFFRDASKSIARDSSKPHILHSATVGWKFFETIVPLEVTNRNLAYRRRGRHLNIDVDKLVPVFVLEGRDIVHHTPAIAAKIKLNISAVAAAARWGKQVRDGDPLEPLPSVPRKGSGKPEPFVSFFVELIGQDPDITLVELRAALLAAHDMRCSTSGIDALLRRHGYI